MIIIADSNEKATNPKAIENFKKVFPDLLISTLDAGDFNVVTADGKRLAIERKKPGDFLSSIGDGRLFNQVERMSEYDASCVVITGNFNYTTDDKAQIGRKVTGWNGKAVRAAIMAVQMSGCPVIISTPRYFPYSVMEFIDLASKPFSHQQAVRVNRVTTFPPTDKRVEILAGFTGVGAKKATNLLKFVANGDDKLGNLADALEWGSIMDLIKEDSKPKLWGEKTVLNLRAVLGLSDGEYLVVKKDNEK